MQRQIDRRQTILWAEKLHDAFLRQFHQSLTQLLGLHGIVETDTTQDFRRKVRNPRKAQFFALAQRIANPQRAMVWNSNHVPAKGFFSQLTIDHVEALP